MSDTERNSPDQKVMDEDSEMRASTPPLPTARDRSPSPTAASPMLGRDGDLQARLETAVALLGREMDTMNAVHFKDYGRVDEFSQLVEETTGLCRDWESHVGELHAAVRGLREKVGEVRKTVDNKLASEGLLSWIDGKQASPSDKDAVAEEKSLLTKAAEARAAASRAATDTARAEQLAANLEAEVAECAAEAERAAEEAEDARKRAEEASKAAEEKRRFEEDQAKKASEEKRKKEEAERKKNEEEERQRQRELADAGSPEEQERRKHEAERLDPKNWSMSVYSVDPGDIDIPIGVVIRSLPGVMSRDDVTVECLEQLGGALTLTDNEELVSQILEVRASNTDKSWTMEAPLSVCLPHCAPRNAPSREPVVKIRHEDGVWEELPSKEVTIEDIKEYKFVEVRLHDPSATLAVVTRTKRESCIVAKRGAKVASSVDPRVCLTFKQATVRSSTNMTLEVQPIELSSVSDLKAKNAPMCDCLIAASPILYYSIGAKKLYKPVMVNVPVPPNPNKSRRPNTAADTGREKSGGKARPKSAMPQYNAEEEGPEDQLLVLAKDAQGNWSHRPKFVISQAKNKDIVNFDITTQTEARLIIFRTLPGTTGLQIEKIVRLLEASLKQRPVQILLRQKNEDASEVVVQCINIAKSERFQKKLTEEEYDLGPGPSPEIIMKEGQEVTLHFRGNIADASEKTQKFVFNSHIKTRIEFSVSEVDKFAQKSIDCYRGFAQMYTRGLVPRPLTKDEEKARKGKSTDMVEGDQLLCELLISLPKPEPEAPKPIIERAPVKLKTDGLVDNDMLRHLAAEMGDEWKRISVYLNIRRSRIQAIMRNNVNANNEQTIYDMLTTWVKRVPKSTNKVEILCQALLSAGRGDLVEELRDREREFRKERAHSARDSTMRKAFIKVAQNAHIITDWKFLARQLRLPEDELSDIDNLYEGMRDRCFQSLVRWRDISGDDATLEKLMRTLRRCRYGRVADQLDYI